VRSTIKVSAFAVTGLLLLAGCGSAAGDSGDSGGSGSGSVSGHVVSAGRTSKWFDQTEYDKQLATASKKPDGPSDQPWLQSIDSPAVDTSQYKKAGGHRLCVSNAGLGNPWRVVGLNTMQHEAKLHGDEISSFTVVDAQSKDEKQIADINDLVNSGNCDALIVTPNTTAALTPAVEQACKKLPVIVFDRGVNTDCEASFVHTAGGYAFGDAAGKFLVQNVKKGGRILVLRALPGVDIFEQRYVAGQIAMEEGGLKIVGTEFTNYDAAKTKSIVSDYLQRGAIDGVFLDAGGTAVAAIEAFQDAGVKVPPITGEDQNDFLQAWQKDKLTAVAPTYPAFQWRTAVIAALQVLDGKPTPKEWVLPQPVITKDTLSQYVTPGMPPLFYAVCGCQKMPGFPKDWQQ
jgi:ribose transport system substrate-binding protein